MIFCQFWYPFWIDLVAFWRSGGTVKTVLPLVQESYFHSLSVCKAVFWDSTLSDPALGDTFCRFGTNLGSMWVPGETILAPFCKPREASKKRLSKKVGQGGTWR